MTTNVEKVNSIKNAALDEILWAFQANYDKGAVIDRDMIQRQLMVIKAADAVLDHAAQADHPEHAASHPRSEVRDVLVDYDPIDDYLREGPGRDPL